MRFQLVYFLTWCCKWAQMVHLVINEVVRYLTRVRGTSVLVDTPLGIQLTRVSCICSGFSLPYV